MFRIIVDTTASTKHSTHQPAHLCGLERGWPNLRYVHNCTDNRSPITEEWLRRNNSVISLVVH